MNDSVRLEPPAGVPGQGEPPLLSVAFIFKNEIRCIERCLKSLDNLASALPCEIVMADTGSTDGSRAVAERYADVLFDFPWINDFSAARNAVLDRCRGKWALVMDCDEWLEGDQSGLAGFLREADTGGPTVGMVTVRNYVTPQLDWNHYDSQGQRIFRLVDGFHYEGAIHEKPVYAENRTPSYVVLRGAVLHHDGYVGLEGPGGRAKRQRNLIPIRKAMEAHPDDLKYISPYVDVASQEPDYLEVIRRAAALVADGCPDPEQWGARVMSQIVQYACDRGMPEALEWGELARRRYPDSIYTRVDLDWCLLMYEAEKELYSRAVPLAETYFRALEDLEQDIGVMVETARGPLSCSNPQKQNAARGMLAYCYAGMGRPEEAARALEKIDDAVMDSQIVGIFLSVLRRLQIGSEVDTAPLTARLWQAVNRPQPSEAAAAERRETFYSMGLDYFREDPDFPPPRPAYSLFLPLAGDCALGDAAAVFGETDPAALSALLARQEDWTRFPGKALAEALKKGAQFPPPGALADPEALAVAAAGLREADRELAVSQAVLPFQPEEDNWTELMWRNALAAAAVQTYDWKGQGTGDDFQDAGTRQTTGLALARTFAATEDALLSQLYTPQALALVRPLPELHRAGLLCGGAFRALDRGDTLGYVRQLRDALEQNPHFRDMVGFLLDAIPLESPEEALARRAEIMTGDSEPEELLEAAEFTLRNGGDRSLACATLTQLYQAGYFPEQILPLLTETLLQPALGELEERYRRNAAALAEYPWLFRKDFPAFSSLPLVFFPFEGGYFPFRLADRALLDYTVPGLPAVTRNFFRDPDRPVLAEDVFSQFELEYLNDNVRPSEYVGKENHLYLAYSRWGEFCAWLQVLDFTELLRDQKIVFLMEGERAFYPLDFKARFGVDYSACAPRPLGLTEVKRLIWHAQLSAHNGGDYFNQIFDFHPNLIYLSSVLLSDAEAGVEQIRRDFSRKGLKGQKLRERYAGWDEAVFSELAGMKDPGYGSCFCAWLLTRSGWNEGLDKNPRFAPAIFFQPHIHNINWEFAPEEDGSLRVTSAEMYQIQASPLFREFRYIKTFLPMRRITSSCAATVRFMWSVHNLPPGHPGYTGGNAVSDVLTERLLNRSYMVPPDPGPLFYDAVVVRFEDAKLNPEATFSALAAFLDLPFTPSMGYCSEQGRRDPYQELAAGGYAVGFDTSSVYKTYDAFLGRNERVLLEYLLRDVYAYYGYAPQTYEGGELEEEELAALADGAAVQDDYIRRSMENYYRRFAKIDADGAPMPPEMEEQVRRDLVEEFMDRLRTRRRECVRLLASCTGLVDANRQPLQPLPLLSPDPERLRQPLYR